MQNRRTGPTNLTTDKRVEAPVYCVLTRVRLRYPWALPVVWWRYLQIQRQARCIPQLKRCALLREDFRTFFILSTWEGEEGYLEFGTYVTRHVCITNRASTHIPRGAVFGGVTRATARAVLAVAG